MKSRFLSFYPMLSRLSARLFLCIFIIVPFLFTSCFTGIESTKKINLTREDKKLAAPTPEEEFFPGIDGIPLKDWVTGKAFIVTDDRALMVFDIYPPVLSPSENYKIKGHTLYFSGIQNKTDAAGQSIAVLKFTDGQHSYFYDTGKESLSAGTNLKSSDIPMLIDLDIVAAAKKILAGKNLWTKSNLWYDSMQERITGKKYAQVSVEDVMPGNMVFPLMLKLATPDGEEFYMLMNSGNGDTESRSFHNLFSLSDIKKHYPDISPETWKLVCEGKVAEGMTKQECRLALGNPSETAAGHDYSQTLDIWTFDNGKILWFEDGKLVKIKG